MSLQRKIAQNTAAQLIGKVISTALGFIAVVIMTRHLGAEQFGWYVTASGFLQFVGIIIDFGFTLTTTNLVAEGRFSEQKILNTLFSWRLITAAVCHALALGLFFLFSYPTSIKYAVAITTISFFASAVNQVFIGYYQAHLKNYLQMIGEVGSRLVLVVGVGFVALSGRGFLATMLMITVSSLVYTAYLWFKGPPLTLEIDPSISRYFFKKTWPVALAIIFNAIYLQGDRVLLPFFVSQVEVGLYGAAYKVLDFIIQAAGLLMGIMFPLLTVTWSKKYFTQFKHYYHLSFNIIALFLFPALVGCVTLNDQIMQLVGGKNFAGSGTILSWLSLTIIGICLGMIGGHAMLAINKQKISLFIFISDALLSIIGYSIFIPRYGVWGAIGVTIFSEWYAGILLCTLSFFYAKCTPPALSLLKIILASISMGVIIYFTRSLPIILSIFLGVAIYGVLILLLKVVSLELIKETLFTRSLSQKT